MAFPRATERAHDLVRERVRPGDTAIDATVGNGHDTVFLAERVGSEGRVIGFDIQAAAIESARRRLDDAGMLDRVELRLAGHESIGEWEGSVRAVMFNLGYLPGGDQAIATRPETTIAAMEAALTRLTGSGLVTVVVYPGHDGGAEEAGAVLDFCRRLDPAEFSAVRYGAVNRINDPPFLIAIERR